VKIPGNAFKKIIIERGHDERALRADDLKQGIDHCLRAVIYAAK
jgi:hypothetical protein